LRDTSRKRDAKTLSEDFFKAVRELERLRSFVVEKVSEIVGFVLDHEIQFSANDEMVVLTPRHSDSFRVSAESQQMIYDLGFKRIEVRFSDLSKIYYYLDGDPRGYPGTYWLKTESRP
jgi:hypothetical protein